jgi:hypothetical protein
MAILPNLIAAVQNETPVTATAEKSIAATGYGEEIPNFFKASIAS